MPVPSIDHPTAEPQTLDEIRDWHRGMVEALVDQRASVALAIRSGAPVAARFTGLTQANIDGYFDTQRQELERLTMLNLVASAEATITVDYFRRVKEKLKDPLAQAYRDWHRSLTPRKQLHPNFDEGGILDVLKDSNVMDNNIVGRYRHCRRPRNW